VEYKRVTGEEFDQKLFRSLARIGSSIRGVGAPKLPTAGRRGIGGRVKPSRATRADWPSDAEIAEMVDRNNDGFVGDGEPWMTRVRRRARTAARGNRPSSGQRLSATGQSSRLARSFLPVIDNPTAERGGRRLRRATGTPAQAKKESEIRSKIKNVLRDFAGSEDVDKRLKAPDFVIGVKRQYDLVREMTSDSDPAALRKIGLPEVIDDPEEAKKFYMELASDVEKVFSRVLAHRRPSEWDMNTDEATRERIEKLVVEALADSPEFEKVFDKFAETEALPRIGIFRKVPELLLQDMYDARGKERPKDPVAAIAGMYEYSTNTIQISQSVLDILDNEEFEDSPGGSLVGRNKSTIFRHEFGHFVDEYIKAFGTEKQKRIRASIVREFKLLSENGEYDGSDWFTKYSMKNEEEFLAELFAMYTSPNPEVRDAIPSGLQTYIRHWLGMNNPDNARTFTFNR